MGEHDKDDDHPLSSTKTDKGNEPAEAIHATIITNSTDPPTSTSILDWISHIPSPEQTPTTPQTSPDTPTHRCQKRRRYSNSLPSDFLGDRRLLRKRRRALQEMEHNIGAQVQGYPQVVTPQAGTGTTSSGVRNASNVSPSKVAALAKQRKNAYNVGQAMQKHGMVKQSEAFYDFPQFVDKVTSIIKPERSSHMLPESARKFQKYLEVFEHMNENTFLHIMFPLLMKDGYQLVKDRADFTDKEKDILKNSGSIYRDFVMDEGIMTMIDNLFLTTLIPSIHSDPKFEMEMAKALQKIANVAQATPKPDFVFGLRPSKVTILADVLLPENIEALLGIAPGMYDPHLIVEGKAESGSAAEAENQARRGGATVVHANRMLRATVGDLLDIDGPDFDSFVFSITMSPNLFEVWVHWYQGPECSQVYHMNRVSTLPLYGYENLDAIRRVLHNVQEWSIDDRFHQRQPLFQRIRDYARREQDEILAMLNKSPKKRKHDTIITP